MIVPREFEGLRVKNADRAETAGDTHLECIGVESGVEEAVNTASAEGRNHEGAVAEGFAAADNPIGVKLELRAAGKRYPHITHRLAGKGSDGDGVTPLKTLIEFNGREFTQGEKLRL
jgi:hypothetical protein